MPLPICRGYVNWNLPARANLVSIFGCSKCLLAFTILNNILSGKKRMNGDSFSFFVT